MAELIAFPGTTEVSGAVAGGKGAALVRMAAAGLPVPAGVVLPVGFFAPWVAAVQASAAWDALVAGGPEHWEERCPEVEALALELAADDAQDAVLDAIVEKLTGEGLVAVRSSSPEEDLASASFAGGYTTVLGVGPEGLLAAVRRCFASALAARVLHYKRAHGFDPLQPRIAVVVQRQLASELAGVGFSLNPANNDHDEAVFDACWGLGEAVVAGLSTPDHVVVQRVGGAVLEHRLGAKQRSLWLGEHGGVVERAGHRSGEHCLDDERIGELTALIGEVEAWLGRPVDIEWAVAEGRLWLLQARPITTHLPLPPALMTAPGERRWLYMDASLSNGLTLNTPVSPLGLDWLTEVFTRLLERFLGPLPRAAASKEQVYMGVGGRLYANLSHVFWLQTPAMFARSQQGVDALMAATVGAVDAGRYRSRRLPPFVSLGALLRLPRMVWAAAPLVARLVATLLAPERMWPRYAADVAATEARLREPLRPGASFEQLMVEELEAFLDLGFTAAWSALGAYGTGFALTEALAPGVDPALAMRVQQGFSGNVVVQMGAALSALAQRLPPEDFDDLDALARRIEERDDGLPEGFLDDWRAVVQRHGHRGPVEMDLAQPRYGDDPRLVLEQLAAVRRGGGELAAEHAARVAARGAAVEELLARAPWWRRGLLRWASRLMDRYAGTRDTPKYLLTLYNSRLRRRALELGAALVEQGRLDDPAQVFSLHLDDLPKLGDPAVDLRARVRENGAFIEQLGACPLPFPPVIDSRGRIIRPPIDDVPGQLRGMGVSPGVARGRVRLLREARGQHIEPGEVLVAYTTDPGWTPLFVGAAAVVLEIGGTLQHGALVAREYGKPCVVGVSRVMERLEDGMVVEVDGSGGVVRVVG